jgi:hypothetical protein
VDLCREVGEATEPMKLYVSVALRVIASSENPCVEVVASNKVVPDPISFTRKKHAKQSVTEMTVIRIS